MYLNKLFNVVDVTVGALLECIRESSKNAE